MYMNLKHNQPKTMKMPLKGYWNILKWAFLEATGRSCGWAKGSARYTERWWQNDASNSVSDKWKARRTFNQARFKAERMVKTNQEIIGEQCIKREDWVMAFSHKNKNKSLEKVLMRSF